jgi:hypothetical protein
MMFLQVILNTAFSDLLLTLDELMFIASRLIKKGMLTGRIVHFPARESPEITCVEIPVKRDLCRTRILSTDARHRASDLGQV